MRNVFLTNPVSSLYIAAKSDIKINMTFFINILYKPR